MKKPSKETALKQLFRGILAIIYLVITAIVVLVILVAWKFARPAPAGTDASIVHQLTSWETGELDAALKSKDSVYPCINNTSSICSNGPGISYYPVGYDNLQTLSSYQPTDAQTLKQIMGTIIVAEDTQITIKTSANAVFRIMFPAGTLANFYSGKGQDYNISEITGKKLMVVYSEQPQHHATTLDKYQLLGSLLINPMND